MDWIDAENEIRKLLPENKLLSFGYKKDVWPSKGAEVEFYVTAVFDNRIVQRFDGLSWSEIIKKIKIWVIPAEAGNDTPPAEENAGAGQRTTNGSAPLCNVVNCKIEYPHTHDAVGPHQPINGAHA
jgi:hypothetical protein